MDLTVHLITHILAMSLQYVGLCIQGLLPQGIIIMFQDLVFEVVAVYFQVLLDQLLISIIRVERNRQGLHQIEIALDIPNAGKP